MTQIFTSDYPLKNIQPGAFGVIEAGQGGQVYVRSSSHDNFRLRIEGIGDLIGHSGLQLREVEVRKIRVENTGDEPLDVVINIGSAEIIDRRASVSETLRVHDPLSGASFENIINLMKDPNAQRAAVSEYGQNHMAIIPVSGNGNMIIDPATNVNGVIVRSVMGNSGTGTLLIYAGGNPPASWLDKTGKVMMGVIGSSALTGASAPVYIKPGDGVWVTTNYSGSNIYITWDYL